MSNSHASRRTERKRPSENERLEGGPSRSAGIATSTQAVPDAAPDEARGHWDSHYYDTSTSGVEFRLDQRTDLVWYGPVGHLSDPIDGTDLVLHEFQVTGFSTLRVRNSSETEWTTPAEISRDDHFKHLGFEIEAISNVERLQVAATDVPVSVGGVDQSARDENAFYSKNGAQLAELLIIGITSSIPIVGGVIGTAITLGRLYDAVNSLVTSDQDAYDQKITKYWTKDELSGDYGTEPNAAHQGHFLAAVPASADEFELKATVGCDIQSGSSKPGVRSSVNPTISNGMDVCTTSVDYGQRERPVVVAAADRETALTGETVAFEAQAVDPDDHSIASYEWSGAVTGTGPAQEATFDSPGTYSASVDVTDADGKTATDEVTVTVEDSTVGEAGTMEVTADEDSGSWQTLSFQHTYDDPVVLMKPLSYNGGNPAHVHVRNVTANSAEVRIDEWDYLDQYHKAETAHFVVLERGRYEIGGLQVEVGTTTTNDTGTGVTFGASFPSKPAVFTQAQTENGGDSFVTRNWNVSTTGFSTKVQEEESNGSHTTETVGYVAVEQGVSSVDGTPFEVGTTTNTVTDSWHAVGFSGSYGSAPAVVADMQTEDGGNTAGLRYRNLTASQVELKVEEEESADTEVSHTDENVGFWAIGAAGTLSRGGN